MNNKPYLETQRVIVERAYNPEYGDSRVCVCGHSYYRHFDSYEQMEAVGCKYCGCHEFMEFVGPEYTRPFFDVFDAIDNFNYAYVSNDAGEVSDLAQALKQDGVYKLKHEEGPFEYNYRFEVKTAPKILLDYKDSVCNYVVDSEVTDIDGTGETLAIRLQFKNEVLMGVDY